MAEKIIAVDRAAAMVEEMLKQNNILQAASTTHASGNVAKVIFVAPLVSEHLFVFFLMTNNAYKFF